jgi:hypothetical protein
MPNAAEKLDLATVASRLASARISGRERRRFRRVPIVVGGRLLSADGREHDCRTADMSPGDIRIATPNPPAIGQQVVLYLESFGRVTGRIVRPCGEGEVAMIFDFSAHKREKLAEQLTLVINKDLGIDEPSRPAIAREAGRSIRIECEAGDAYDGNVVDFSLAGLTIHSRRPPPPIGAWVRIGGVYGRVARLIEGGFAVDFDPRRKPAP